MAVTVKVSEFGAIVDTLTYEYIVPKITDNILTGNVLAMKFLQNQKPATAWGNDVTGTFLGVPIKYQKSTSGGWYSGFDIFSTGQKNTRVLATYSPKQLYWSVGATGIQVGVNQGPQKILDLISTEMNSVADDMMDTFGDGFYSDGTGTSNKQLTGLDAAVDDGKISIAVNKSTLIKGKLQKGQPLPSRRSRAGAESKRVDAKRRNGAPNFMGT